MKKESELNKLFEPVKREHIESFFKGKKQVKKVDEMVDLLFKWCVKPGLCGMDFPDLENMVKFNDCFKLIETDFENIGEFQDLIDSCNNALVEFDTAPGFPLKQLETILENHFIKVANGNGILWQWFAEKTISKKNPRIKMILAWKEKKQKKEKN